MCPYAWQAADALLIAFYADASNLRFEQYSGSVRGVECGFLQANDGAHMPGHDNSEQGEGSVVAFDTCNS